MEIKPVKIKRKPGYPTIKTFVDNPGLLSKSVPFAWIRNQYAATTLATFILCGAGNQSSAQKTKPATVIVSKVQKQNKPAAIQTAKHDPVKIARIFSHGDGSGAIGCMVSSPPVFISEDEARKIIFTALKEENIDFSTINTPVLKFRVPTIVIDFHNKVLHLMDKKEITIEIKMDGYNVKNNLAIEYVSAGVVNRLDPYDEMESSVQRIDTKRTAERIREKLIAQNKVNAAVFYDPITYYDRMAYYNEEQAAIDRLSSDNTPPPTSKDRSPSSRDLLKAQVKDFIEWIKKEGIIKQ